MMQFDQILLFMISLITIPRCIVSYVATMLDQNCNVYCKYTSVVAV